MLPTKKSHSVRTESMVYSNEVLQEAEQWQLLSVQRQQNYSLYLTHADSPAPTLLITQDQRIKVKHKEGWADH